MHREVQRNLGRLGLPSGHADGLESAHTSQPTSGPHSVSSLFNVSPALSLRRWMETSPTHTQEVSAVSGYLRTAPSPPGLVLLPSQSHKNGEGRLSVRSQG